jgi:hypothetical protein
MYYLPSTKIIEIEGFERPAVEPPELPEAVLVRHASPRDEARIRVLARLDDRRMPGGPFVVAELGGEIVAAMSLKTRAVVADPFRRTADAVDLLRMRASQLAERELRASKRRPDAALHPAPAA